MSSTETKNRQAGEKRLSLCLFLNSSSRPLDLIRKRHLGYEPELNFKDENGRTDSSSRLN